MTSSYEALQRLVENDLRHLDPRAGLRAAANAVEAEFARLPATDSDPSLAPVRDRWQQLLRLLDLGSAPETRDCPGCGHKSIRTATSCGHCWIKLTPPSE